MGMDVGGPSAMSLYAGAGPQGTPADTGSAMGRGLYDAELAARTRYADPATPNDGWSAADAQRSASDPVPNWYNTQSGLPVKYTVPSAAKERMQARQAVREAASSEPRSRGLNVIRTDPISEEEVDYLQSMKDQAELADFDRYVNTLIDPRKPGNLKWLMEIYPDYVNRRIQQVHTDYEYALRGQMIDSWGINTFDDLHFKYLQDQGKISGPKLVREGTKSMYSPGWLSPWAFKHERQSGLRLPFASARVGAGANDPNGWRISEAGGNPFDKNAERDLTSMARSMYNKQMPEDPQ